MMMHDAESTTSALIKKYERFSHTQLVHRLGLIQSRLLLQGKDFKRIVFRLYKGFQVIGEEVFQIKTMCGMAPKQSWGWQSNEKKTELL